MGGLAAAGGLLRHIGEAGGGALLMHQGTVHAPIGQQHCAMASTQPVRRHICIPPVGRFNRNRAADIVVAPDFSPLCGHPAA
jgi:hypothetical protein